MRALALVSDVRLVHCHTSRELSIRRFIDRFERGVRHACFEDRHRIEHLQAGGTDSAWDRAEPLQLNLPTLVVETSDGYTPDLDQIIAFAQRRLL